jgi:DNA helicase HerA-like ATPase
VQAWTSHLFVELARYSMRAPQAKLQALVMLDEADQYMPATSKPPSKEPLMDLLKRARSGGLGIMLATQTPGDLDYKSRDLITTWFIGKIGDSRSVDKVRPLLERKPAVAGKLGQLPAGQFVVVNDTSVAEIQRRPSLLRTDQLPEQEIVALARGNRR